MTKRIQRMAGLLLVFALLAGCTPAGETPDSSPPGPGASESQPPEPTVSVEPEPSQPPEPTVSVEPDPLPDPIAEQLAELTVEQKVGQLMIAGFYGATPGADVIRDIQEYQVGGVILFKRNVSGPAQLVELTNALKELNGDYIPLLISTDEEGGTITRVPGEVDQLPIAYRFGQIEDPDRQMDACFLYGQALAARCAAFGINMSFAPVMDIWSNPDNTVIGRRAFGTTVAEVSYPASETAWGMMTGGVIPVGKHFPGHGDTAVDSHYGLPVVDKSVDQLWVREFVPFRRAIEATCVYGAAGGDSAIPALMVGHILLTEVDPDRPASLSRDVVTGLLRERMGFDGVICTDGLTMEAVTDTYGVGEGAVLALEAGCDLLLVCHETDAVAEAYEALLEAVNSGRVSEERLDESVYRILRLKEQFGVNSDPLDPDVDIAALNEQVRGVKDAMN